MDPTATLSSIAAVFPALSDQAVEENLVIFDSLLNVSGAKYRPVVAEIVRNAASAAQSLERRNRLLRAAAAIAAGEPCALTPEGLTAAQAAAASTVTADQWVEPEPPPPAVVEDEDDEPDDEDDTRTVEAPPTLPHLSVRHFFRDLVVRIAQDFSDADGNQLHAGNVLKLMSVDREDDGDFVLIPLAGPVRRIRLGAAQQAAVISNAGNAWLQPVPSSECLADLCHWIQEELSGAEDALDEDSDDYEERVERITELLSDVEECRGWLETDSARRGEVPQPASLPLAVKIFGRTDRGAVWIRLLYAGVAVTIPS
ncbi:MAG TPA: hypothetical protein VGL53_12095 [Bryobacteraceae bacterium]|jgi:hypothetical protein